jgi:hypothetical protein
MGGSPIGQASFAETTVELLTTACVNELPRGQTLAMDFEPRTFADALHRGGPVAYEGGEGIGYQVRTRREVRQVR